MHRRPLEPGPAREIEEPGTGAIVRGDLAHQGQRALDALGAGEAARVVVVGFLGHEKREVRIVREATAIMPL